MSTTTAAYVCLVHPYCQIHSEYSCFCVCWQESAQCTYGLTIDKNDRRNDRDGRNIGLPNPMDLDSPSPGERELHSTDNPIRDNDLHTPPTLCDPIDIPRPSIIRYSHLPKTGTDNNKQSYIQTPPGTTECNPISPTNINPERQPRTLSKSNEHIIPKNTDTTNYVTPKSINKRLSPIKHNSPVSKRTKRLPHLRDTYNPRSIGSNNQSSTDNTTPENSDDEPAMEICIETSPLTRGNGQRQSSYTSPCTSHNSTQTKEYTRNEGGHEQITQQPTPQRNTNEYTPTQPLARRLFDGRRHSESDDSDASSTTSRTGLYYTATITRNNIERLPSNPQIGPTFLIFDHGTHYHLLWYATTDSNAHRQLKRIARFINATSAGFTECASTKQTVRHIWKFIQYCIRYGLHSVKRCGFKNDSNITKIMNEIKQLEIPDKTDENHPCRQYAESQKEKHKPKRQFKNITQTITDIIKSNNIETQTDWDLKIDYETKMQLMSEFGLRVNNYIQTILKINRAEFTKQIKQKTLLQIYEDILEDNEFTENDIKGAEWLLILFNKNNINIIEFFAWHEIIKTHRYTKINTIVLNGPTNAGKSMLLELMIKPLKPEEIPRERDNSSFHLDQLPAATVATFEEPLITPTNVGTWKLLMEGKPIKTDIKHKDKERINRIPIWITTASPIDNNVDSNEKAQLQQRFKLFKFTKQIEHNIIKNTKSTIPKCPIYLENKHIAALYISLWDDIFTTIQKLDEQYILGDDKLPIKHKCKELLLQPHLQTQLRLLQKREESSETQETTELEH